MEKDWLNLLKQVESDPDLSHTNVLDKIKAVLKADRILYEDWQKNDFHVDHLLKVSRKINDHVAGQETANSQSVLHMFTKFGMVKTVKSLVKYGADVKTALLHAMESGFVEIANAIIDNGANLDIDTVKRLIELKADVNARNAVSKTLLHYSIRHGNIDVLKYIIEEKGGDGSVDVNLMGGNLVRYAAECRQLAVFKYLVEDLNFDYETPDELGKSAIHYAAAAPKDWQNKGVNHNVVANNMLSPMSCASMSSNLEVMKYLLEEKHVDINFQDKEEGYTALYSVCNETTINLEAVKYLIEKGADCNVKTKLLRTPVQVAAYYGKLDVIKYLVEEIGADIHIKDIFGHNELSTAVEQGQFETVKYFIEKHDMDVNIKDIDQRTLLHIAVHSGNVDIVKYLINEKGAKKYINYKRSDNHWTPLHESTTKGYKYITQLLLKEGATVNTPCMYGVLPIHQTVKRGYHEVAEQLLNYGSDLDPKDDNGLTPLHKAAKEGDLRMVQLLVKRGANIGIRNTYNATARDIALGQLRKYQAVVNYLNSSSEPNVSGRSRDYSSPEPNVSGRSRDYSSPEPNVSGRSRDYSSPEPNVSGRSRDYSSPEPNVSGRSRDFHSSIDFKSFAGRRRQN